MVNSNTLKFPVGITGNYFGTVSRQSLPMHDAIGEAVDNGMANSCGQAIILVSLDAVPKSELIRVTVADWGVGMDKKSLVNAFQFGSEHERNEGPLCIYGMGLKNFLLVASQNKYDWFVASKKPGDEVYNVVEGPFKLEMEMREESAVPLESVVMRKRLSLYGKPSTIVSVVTDKRVASTMLTRSGTCAPSRVTSTNVLRKALAEHFGVKYRGFLTADNTGEPPARILLTDYRMANGETQDVFITPLYQPYAEHHVTRFNVSYGGYEIPVTVDYGVLDKSMTRSCVTGGHGMKYYYQANMLTQGFDIEYGNRTVATSQFESLWSITRHPAFNYWTGCIHVDISGLPRGFLNTLANKSSVDLSDAGWQAIFDEIRKRPELTPKEERNNTVEAYRDAIVSRLQAVHEDHEIETSHPVFANRAQVDILDVAPDGTCEIYNIKNKVGNLVALQELRTYWDGLISQGLKPKVGYLYCRSCGPMLEHTCKELSNYIQAMTDEELNEELEKCGNDVQKLPHYNMKIVVDECIPD